MLTSLVATRAGAGPDTGARDAGALYERYYPVVFAFACRRTRDYMQAEDIAAQTFVQALQALDRYEDRGVPMTAWLLRIASNLIAADGRRRSREPRLAHALAPEDGDIPSGEVTPEEWVERWESASGVRAQLAILSAEQRRALWLRFGEGRAMDDVAGLIGRSPGATKQLLHRTIKTLRTRMQTDGRPEGSLLGPAVYTHTRGGRP